MRISVLFTLTNLVISSQLHATDIKLGAQLFSQHCASCHGSDGKGGTGVPLSNKSFQQQVSDYFLFNTIKYGRPGRVMPASDGSPQIWIKNQILSNR